MENLNTLDRNARSSFEQQLKQKLEEIKAIVDPDSRKSSTAHTFSPNQQGQAPPPPPSSLPTATSAKSPKNLIAPKSDEKLAVEIKPYLARKELLRKNNNAIEPPKQLVQGERNQDDQEDKRDGFNTIVRKFNVRPRLVIPEQATKIKPPSLKPSVVMPEKSATPSLSSTMELPDGEYYNLNPAKKGLVLFFFQSVKKPGWEKDQKLVRDLFQGQLGCEMREFKDCRKIDMKRKLRDLTAVNIGQGYNYLIVIISAFGGLDDQNRNYFKAAEGEKVHCREIEDFILNNPDMKWFNGLPKVIIWNACRGKKLLPLMRTRMETDSSSEATSPKAFLKDETLLRERPSMCDYLILYASERDSCSFNDVNQGSYFIKLLCQELGKQPKYDLEMIIKRINRQLANLAIYHHDGVPIGLSLPYLANCSFSSGYLPDNSYKRNITTLFCIASV